MYITSLVYRPSVQRISISMVAPLEYFFVMRFKFTTAASGREGSKRIIIDSQRNGKLIREGQRWLKVTPAAQFEEENTSAANVTTNVK